MESSEQQTLLEQVMNAWPFHTKKPDFIQLTLKGALIHGRNL